MSVNPDVFQAAVSLLAAHLSNPNTRIDASEVPSVMQSFFDAAARLATGEPAAPALPKPAAGTPALAAPARDPEAHAQVPSVLPAGIPPEALASLGDSAVFVGGDLPEAGAHLQARVWAGVPRATQDKFREIIKAYNIPIGLDGFPVPRRPIEKLISESGMHVADPITGQYHTMLKRHLKVAHDLGHDELLAMFGLSERQLPRSGPAYSAAKAEQAKRTGLGRTKPAEVVAEPKRRAKGAKRERVSA